MAFKKKKFEILKKNGRWIRLGGPSDPETERQRWLQLPKITRSGRQFLAGFTCILLTRLFAPVVAAVVVVVRTRRPRRRRHLDARPI